MSPHSPFGAAFFLPLTYSRPARPAPPATTTKAAIDDESHDERGMASIRAGVAIAASSAGAASTRAASTGVHPFVAVASGVSGSWRQSGGAAKVDSRPATRKKLVPSTIELNSSSL